MVRAARERCVACLCVPAPRRGSFKVGAASDGAGRGRRTSGERLACVHWLPRRARCCAGSRDACARWKRAGRGWSGAQSGLGRLCVTTRVRQLRLNCPTLAGAHRVDFRRSATARGRCDALLCVPAAQFGWGGLSASSPPWHGQEAKRERQHAHGSLRNFKRGSPMAEQTDAAAVDTSSFEGILTWVVLLFACRRLCLATSFYFAPLTCSFLSMPTFIPLTMLRSHLEEAPGNLALLSPRHGAEFAILPACWILLVGLLVI